MINAIIKFSYSASFAGLVGTGMTVLVIPALRQPINFYNPHTTHDSMRKRVEDLIVRELRRTENIDEFFKNSKSFSHKEADVKRIFIETMDEINYTSYDKHVILTFSIELSKSELIYKSKTLNLQT